MTTKNILKLENWYVNDIHPEKACYTISSIQAKDRSDYRSFLGDICTVYTVSPDALDRANILAASPKLLKMVNELAVLLAGVSTEGMADSRAENISLAIANASRLIDSITDKEICFD